MNPVITVILTIISLLGLIGIVYIVIFNNLQSYRIRINEAEGIIDELLRKKYDSLSLIKDVILDETELPDKTFDEFSADHLVVFL